MDDELDPFLRVTLLVRVLANREAVEAGERTGEPVEPAWRERVVQSAIEPTTVARIDEVIPENERERTRCAIVTDKATLPCTVPHAEAVRRWVKAKSDLMRMMRGREGI